jgi:nicotinate-nucleotide pyrophosphorylase (carboxylating)
MLKNGMPETATTKTLVRRALEEDLARAGDITSNAIVSPKLMTTAVMRARKPGIVAGMKIAEMVFHIVDPKLKVTRHVQSGSRVSKNQKIMTVRGSARSILAAERTALNFVSHLSGIATLTGKYIDQARGTKAKIRCTRKTTPGLRALEKYAVRAGGGVNHRSGLYDAVLIKDNHIALAGSVAKALDKIKTKKSVQIEVDTLKQLAGVLKHVSKYGGADSILLDNMDIKTLKKAVALVKGKIPLEASGGVNLKTVRGIAKTGVDYIAVGALTHSAPALDIGLDIDL